MNKKKQGRYLILGSHEKYGENNREVECVFCGNPMYVGTGGVTTKDMTKEITYPKDEVCIGISRECFQAIAEDIEIAFKNYKKLLTSN